MEFIYDVDTKQFYFLEVNTRLQVEHGVTEEIFSVDLVSWMLELGQESLTELEILAADLKPQGHSIQVHLDRMSLRF